MRSSDLYQFWFLALLKPSDRVLKLRRSIAHLIQVLSVDSRVWLGSVLKLLRCVAIRAELQVRALRAKSTQGTKDGLQSLEEQEFNHLGVCRRGARLCAPTYEQFVGFI